MIGFESMPFEHRLSSPGGQGLDGEAEAFGGVSVAAAHRRRDSARAALGASEAERRATGVALKSRRFRFLVAAFGDAGHAFPAIALARALRRRGHEVLVETWEHWREAVEAEGLGFTAAEEYKTFPPPAPDSADGASAADAALALVPLMEEFRPDVVVSDVLTLAPALAAEKAGRRRATLIPHVYPVHEPGMPFFAFGAQPPRTPVGKAIWRAWLPVLTAGLKRGRREMNEMRAAVGLPPLTELHGGISADLALVATFPQLEYPRRWPAGVRVTGPMEFEIPHPEDRAAGGGRAAGAGGTEHRAGPGAAVG